MLTSTSPQAALVAQVPALRGTCRLHPDTERAGRLARAWAREVGLTADDAGEHRLRGIGGHRLAGRMFSELSFAQLALLTRWCTWIGLLDDHWDERARPAHAREVDDTFNSFIRITEDDAEPASSASLVKAFNELWRATAPPMSPDWRRRFRAGLESNRRATLWELDTRRAGRPASLAAYPAHRRATFATFIYEVGEAILGTELPHALATAPAWTEVADAANDAAAWCNDLVSLAREQRGGSLTNHVLVAEHELGLSRAEAIDWVIRRTGERMHDLHLASRALSPLFSRLALAPGTARAASKVACAYLLVPHANLEWMTEAGRYRAAPHGNGAPHCGEEPCSCGTSGQQA
ncbi:terpene synthase family protein [Streptomyces xanthophaeus]